MTWRLGKSEPFQNSQSYAVFSPDGHWLAYVSTESGRSEVYVGRELFFRKFVASRIMVASYETTGHSFAPGKPRLGSETAFTTIGAAPNFDIAPDGKRFAVLMSAEKLGKYQNELTVLLNFFTGLRRRAQ